MIARNQSYILYRSKSQYPRQIRCQETLTIEGNGATIVQAVSSVMPLIQISQCDAIAFQNVRLIKGTGQSGAGAVYTYACGTVSFESANIQSLCNGFHFVGTGTGNHYDTIVQMDDVTINASQTGILGDRVCGGTIRDTDITAATAGVTLSVSSANVHIVDTEIHNAVIGVYYNGATACEASNVTLQNTATGFRSFNHQKR